MQADPRQTHPVCAFVGGDAFLRAEALGKLLSTLSEDADELGPTRVDGTRAALAEVLDEVRTVSLLGGRRIVVVEDADAFIKAHRSALEKYCSAPSETGTLILLCNSMPKNTKLHRIIEASGVVHHLQVHKGRAVLTWISERGRTAYGKTVAPAASASLRRHVGDSPGALDAELSKLAAFVGERSEILAKDVDVLTGQRREERVFAVTDAIGLKDTGAALKHWEQVLATDRSAPARAIGGLAWGVRQLLEARRSWERGTGIGELARRMRTDPSVLQSRLERTTLAELEAQQRDLLQADLAVKTGASTVEVAIEKFIVKHTTNGSS